MIYNLYDIFYKKLPCSIDDVLPEYDSCKLITCLNSYYLVVLKQNKYKLYEKFDFIASDGMLPILLNKYCGKAKSIRLSFDLSSIAGLVFNDVIKHNFSLYVLGAKPGEVDLSVNTILKNYHGIQIAGYHHGYVSDNRQQIVNEIIHSGAKVVIIGMGAPKQDEIAVMLKESGFIGTVYTCGGFIHQTQYNIVSFPNWSNRFGLRWLYRIFTQKGVFLRLLKTVPYFLITYIYFLLVKFDYYTNHNSKINGK